ncbi:hypothetical protein HD553DRAFT_344052 [Filobasidium floriforme]|uniref:uncharacterized protein n=1 Tax=Filobasidium floriforme TaxID=5210 RepID=UPI001E8D246B|nr:uncharacterized protein HD553DRAFT_344052 [Filobasidium floriforme]KAH8081973.1 hypothetical protein HD553DRAFT_344052 [Filobasidium floriforme]
MDAAATAANAKRDAARASVARSAQALARRRAADRRRARIQAATGVDPGDQESVVDNTEIDQADFVPDATVPTLPRRWIQRTPLAAGTIDSAEYHELIREFPTRTDGSTEPEYHPLKSDLRAFSAAGPDANRQATMKAALNKMVRARRLNARIPAPANYEEVVDLYDDTDAARSLLDSLYPSSHSDYQTSGPRLKAWQRAVLFYEALDPNSNNVGNDGWNPAKRALLPNIDHVMRDFGDGPDGWPTWISDPTSPDKGGQIDPTTSDAARYRAWVVVKTLSNPIVLPHAYCSPRTIDRMEQ